MEVPVVIPEISTCLATKILLLDPQSPSSTKVTADENADPFLLMYPFMSVFSVAVPSLSSMRTTRSALVGADSAVVAVDWSVRSTAEVAVVGRLIITIPSPPSAPSVL